MTIPQSPFLISGSGPTDPSWVLSKNQGIRAVSGISCILTICGSLLIIISYTCFRSLRTRARLILVHLAIADMGVGIANLVGISVDFDRYFYHVHTASETEPFFPNSTDIQNLCETQAFFAEYCTLSSVLWTTCLAAYMYLLIIHKSQKQMNYFMWFSYLFCYGMPLLVSVWMILTGRLGYAPYDSSGWCAVIVVKPYRQSWEGNSPKTTIDMFSSILGYDLWIFLTIILIIFLYISVFCYVKQEYHKLKQSTDASVFWQAMYNIDYKFIMIPLMFIILRIWTVILSFLLIYIHIPPERIGQPVLMTLLYLSGFGDSGQGFINAILFVAFTHSVRKRLLSWCRPTSWRQRLRRTIQREEESLYSESRFLVKNSDPVTYEHKRYHSIGQESGVSVPSYEQSKECSPMLETVTPIESCSPAGSRN